MAASNFKSRLNDITVIKDTLNLTFDELNGSIKISVVDTVSSDISGQTVIAHNADGTGNQISSTVGAASKRGLDVNVVNLSAIPIEGSFTANVSGQTINVGNTVSVTGTVNSNISGQVVTISGQSVNVPNTVSVTGTVATNISGQSVNVPNTVSVTGTVNSNISGQSVNVPNTVSVTGTVATNISGQSVNVLNTVSVTGTVNSNISGQTVNISGQTLNTMCYGTSGTGDYKLLTDSTGKLITLARNYDGTGNQITSTVGGSSKRGLDVNLVNLSAILTDISGQSVNVPNTVSVTGTVATNISGQTVNIGNIVSVTGAFSTNISGQTVNISGQSVNVLNTVSVTGTVNISGQTVNVQVVDENSTIYDLLNNGSTLWAGSTPLVQFTFNLDGNGREGWRYTNLSNINNTSRVTWYNNTELTPEANISKADVTSMYAIITLDYVLNVPTLSLYSKPTGTGDVIADFAHSRWDYQMTAGDKANLKIGESIMIYVGQRPQYHTDLPGFAYELASSSGSALNSEIISHMSINTPAAATPVIYILQYTGYFAGRNREYVFKNSKERLIQSGLVKLSELMEVQTNDKLATETTLSNISTKIDTLTFNAYNDNIFRLYAHDDISKAVLDNIKTNTDVLNGASKSGTKLDVNVSGQTVNIGNIVSVTGAFSTDISGQTVNIGNIVSVTGAFSTDISGQTVNVGNTVSVTGTVATNISGQTLNIGNLVGITGPVSLIDTSGNNITSTMINLGQRGLDTASAIFSITSGSLNAISSTVNAGKRGLDVNVINTTIGVTGTVATDISGQNVNVSGQTVNIGNIVSVTGAFTTTISGQTVNIGNTVSVTGTVATNISGQTVNISGQTLDTHMYGSNYDTVAPANNAVYVDANGFLTSNIITAVHDNIYIGRKNNVADLTFLSTGNGVWNTYNQVSTTDDGWYYTTTGIAHGSLMIYNNGGWGVVKEFPTQSDFTFSNISTIYSIIKNYKPDTQSGVRINVYSRPTGSGDVSATYKSKWVYTLKSGQFLATGVSYMIYYGNLSKVKNNDTECPRIEYEYNAGLSEGTRANGEVIAHIEITIDDAAGTDLYKLLVVEGAVYESTRLINYYFTSDIAGESELAVAETRDFLTELTKTTDLGAGTTALDVQVQNFPTGFDANITNASINSNLYDGVGNALTSHVVDANRGVDTYLLGVGTVSTALYTNLRDTSGSAIGVSGNPLQVAFASGGGSSDGQAYLYNGAGTTPITSTTVSTQNGIDSNIINTVSVTGSVNVANTVSVTGTVATNISGQSVNVANTVSVTGAVDTNISGQSVNVANVVSVTGTVDTNISGQSVNVTNTVSVTGTVGLAGAPPVTVSGTVAVADATGNSILTLINNRQTVSPQGARGNFANNVTIAGWADTLSFDAGFNYGIDSVFCYEDTTTAATGDIAIIGSTNNTTWQLIGLVTPILSYNASGTATGRWATTRLNVAPFRYMELRNVGPVTLTGVVASIFSGKASGAV